MESPLARSERSQLENPDTHCSLGYGVPVLIKTSGFDLVGVIHDITPHALSILVKQALSVGSEVSIEFGAVTREGEVISCRANGSKCEACIAMPNTGECDLRAAERFPVAQEVRIWVSRSESELDAVVADLSVRGIGLEMSTMLEPGESVMVESACNLAFGIIHYCRALSDGRFRAGMEVFHVMPKEQLSAA